MKILGISRSPRFSPHCEERDAAIFSAVCRRLEAAGCTVAITDEDHLSATQDIPPGTYAAAFSMARSETALRLLEAAERTGLCVINSPTSLRRTTRGALAALFSQGGIPIAGTRVLTDAERMAESLTFPCWLKRGDACAQNRDDVTFIRSREELTARYETLRSRGAVQVVVSRHEQGDLVKFYGVAGTPFFHYDYPTRTGCFSKFGLETINGAPHDYVFSAADLHATAQRAASLSGIHVYGGDAIIRPDGTFCLIDFNDWPSFSACREAAAQAITARLLSVAQERQKDYVPSAFI